MVRTTRALLAITSLCFALCVEPDAVSVARAATKASAAGAELAALNRSMQALAERVTPSVVQVLTSGFAPATEDAASSEALLLRRQGSGSGMILDPAGYILTNAHVVDGALRIQVRIARAAAGAPNRSIVKSRGKLVDATVIGVDPETDLAVIKVPEKDLPALRLGDSDALRPGHVVLAFGSPHGLESSVSMGVVSAVGRQFRLDDPMVYIQTDTPINPGNSGGPLVGADGTVVGINTMILSRSGGSEGLGFAVPSNIAANVYEQIRSTGRVRRGTIGVNAQTITPEVAKVLALDRDWGVVLGDVVPGGPAEGAGLQIGDVVVSLDGKPMENGRQLDVNVYRCAVGDRVTLEVLRSGRRLVVKVPVVDLPGDPGRFAELATPEDNLVPRLGILAVSLEGQVLGMIPSLRIPGGVLVVGATAGGFPGSAGGLVPGDVIHTIDRASVADLDALRAATNDISSGRTVVLQIERRGQLMFLEVETR